MKNIILTACAVFLLAACSQGIKESMGLVRTAPDEFIVLDAQPLTVPPNFDLVPPRDGEPVRSAADIRAKEAVLGTSEQAPVPANITAGQSALLQRAGANGADPGIRARLGGDDPDVVYKTTAEKLGIVKPKSNALNPYDEAERLRKEKINTVPVTKPSDNAQ